jgi:hypothetical protein
LPLGSDEVLLGSDEPRSGSIAPEEDSLRIYVLCAECQGRIESLGTGQIELEDPDVYLL